MIKKLEDKVQQVDSEKEILDKLDKALNQLKRGEFCTCTPATRDYEVILKNWDSLVKKYPNFDFKTAPKMIIRISLKTPPIYM